jgi:hypothetical protein
MLLDAQHVARVTRPEIDAARATQARIEAGAIGCNAYDLTLLEPW